MKNGGYAIISHDDINIFNKVDNAYNAGKPILFYDDDKTCYFIDSIKKVDDDYVLVKGGKTITITDANTVSSTGSADSPTMENIKDLAGRNRFIEGSAEGDDIEGVTYNYAKWSLSGSHLMFVVAGVITAGTTVSVNKSFMVANNLPQWIKDKIYPITGTYVGGATMWLSENGYAQSDTIPIYISKSTTVSATPSAGKTLTNNTYFRLVIDLLIDAE